MRDWKKEIQELHPNLVPLEDIKNGETKFKARCSIDNYEWEYRGYDLLRGHGCHQCSGRPRYTTETFKEKAKKINPNIKILGEYKNSHTKIEFKCLICEEFGIKKPNSILNGRGCRLCGYKKVSNKLRKTTEEFKEEFYVMVKNEYTVLGEYQTTEIDIQIKHNICGEIFSSRPHNLLNKLNPSRCPKCNGGVRKKTKEYHNKEIQELTNDEYSFLSEYKGNNKKSLYMHNLCDQVFETTPDSFINQGTRCPYCNTCSKGELEIKRILTEMKINFEREKTFSDLKYKGKLRMDFYIKSLNCCIEYDGKQHFEPINLYGGQKCFEVTRKRDIIKNEYCLDKGIHLLRIRYDEKDIKSLIESFIEKVKK